MAEDERYALGDLLPDFDRTPGRWAQLAHDLHAPAPASLWASRVTEKRINRYDGIRAYMTRGSLLVVLAVLLVFADGTRPLAWALLSLGAVQVVLELHLQGKTTVTPRSRYSPTHHMLAVMDDWQFGKTLLNVTGALGGLAVPANLVAVLFLTGPGDPGWVKVAALAVAICYGNSGIIAVLTDLTYYSAHQSLPRILIVGRAYLWLIATAALAGLVGASVLLDRWHPDMVPLAWAACALASVIGMRTREYDRFMRMSGEELLWVMTDARRRLAADFHDALTGARALSRNLSRDDQVPAEYKIDAADLAPRITLVQTEMVDEHSWDAQDRKFTLKGIVAQLGNEHDLQITDDLRIEPLGERNGELARQLITTIVTNAGQALALREVYERPVSVTGYTTHGKIHIVIRDPLPLIPPASWCPDGGTMSTMRNRLRERGGDLTQAAVEGGKEIHGVWNVRPPTPRRDTTR